LRGKPVFVDPGTFVYNDNPEMRRYFRTAHNILDEQAEPAGTFAWKNPPHGVCEEWNGDKFIGFVGPWRRHIQYDSGEFAITDTVAGDGRMRWRFHLHPI